MSNLSEYNYRIRGDSDSGSDTKPKPYLRLIDGADKQYSVTMVWEYPALRLTITRFVRNSSVNNLQRDRRIEFVVRDAAGFVIKIPPAIKKHEVSIARWLKENYHPELTAHEQADHGDSRDEN